MEKSSNLELRKKIKFKTTEYLAYFEGESKLLGEKIANCEARIEINATQAAKAQTMINTLHFRINEYARAKARIDTIISNEAFKIKDEAGL